MSVPSTVPVPPAAQSTAAEPELPDAQPAEPSVRRDLTTQELRLALTFTGGVSLAVWMGGVAREVDLLVQASDARVGAPAVTAPPLQPRERSVVDLYRPCSTSWTSRSRSTSCPERAPAASTPHCSAWPTRNGSAWSACARRGWTWAPSATCSATRGCPTRPRCCRATASCCRLHQAIAAMHQSRDNEAADGQSASDTRQTDVFITTTLLSAEINRFTDDFGTEITDANHHGQFHFNEQTMGAKEAVGALALAARSSASFPGAFEPAFVPVGQAGPTTAPRHGDLQQHDALRTGRRTAACSSTGRSARCCSRSSTAAPTARCAGPCSTSCPRAGCWRSRRRTFRPNRLGLAGALVHDLAATLSQSIAADLAAINEHNDRTRSVGDTRLRLATLGADSRAAVGWPTTPPGTTTGSGRATGSRRR